MISQKYIFSAVTFFIVAVFFVFSAHMAFAVIPVILGSPMPQAVNVTGSGAQITWTTDIPSDSAVYYGTTNTPTSLPYSSYNRCDSGGLVTSHCVNLMGLAYNTVYYFKVSSSADSGATFTEGSGYQFTSASSGGGGGGGGTSYPPAPSGLYTTSVSSTSVSLSWTDTSTNETGFRIWRTPSSQSSWTQTGSVGTGQTSFSDNTVTSGQSYTYKVTAYNSYGDSYDSNWLTVTASSSGGGTVPSSPSNLRLDPTPTSSAIYLKWNDNSGSEDKFNIERSNANTGSWTFLYQAGANSIAYTDTSVTSGSWYDYRVQACLSGYGCSGYTYLYNVSTSGSGTPPTSTSTQDWIYPTAPTAVSSYAVSSSGISISWSGATDNVGITMYHVYRNGAYLASITSGLSYQDTGLSPSTSYTYTVMAYDANGNYSPQSISTSATTHSANTTTGATATLSGKIKTSEGTAVSGANIYLYAMNYSYSAVTDSAGAYTISGIVAATYQVYVYPPSGASQQQVFVSVALAAGETKTQDFTFTVPPKTIKGKVSYADGRPVTNAGVGAHSPAGNGWGDATVDSTGMYVMKVSGGKWQVGVYPKYSGTTGTSQSTDWSWSELYREVAFAEDNTAEEKVVDFTVQTADATVKGMILKPDGSAPALYSVSVKLRNSSGRDFWPYVESSGSFQMPVPADTYIGEVYSSDSKYGGTTIWKFSVTSGVYDLGKIYLSAYGETIKGKVANAKGAGVADVWINANQYDKGKYAQAKTGSDGMYTLPVSAGVWNVSVYPDYNSGYVYSGGMKTITVASGQTAVADFTVESLDAQITGTIVDASGQVIPDAYGWVSTASYETSTTYTPGMPAQMSFGGSVEKGSFTFRVPPGTWNVSVYLSSDSKYAPPSSQSVTVLSGETKKIVMAIKKNDAEISGFFVDSAGKVITNLDASRVKMYVSSRAGAWHNATIDAVKGSFSALVSEGTWYVGYWAEAQTGYVSQAQDIEVKLALGEKKSINLVLTKANSAIAGTVKTADGKTLANAWVSVDSRSYSTATYTEYTPGSASPFIAGTNTDANGAFKLAVPAGSYFVHAHYPQTEGYINPPEASVTVGEGETKTIELAFRKAEVTISGTVLLDQKGVSAFVWAWSESGGYASARADDTGKYSFTVAKYDTWRVGASREGEAAHYKAAETRVEVKDVSVSQDIVLVPMTTTYAQAVEKIVETVKPQTVELTDGAKTVLPANALATSGSANVTMKPTVETPSFGISSVVGTSYSVEAKDTTGKAITSLNAEVTITIPYDEAELTSKGLTVNDLVLSFFDETTQTWKPLEKQIIDKETNTVSAVVNHLTLFALVAPADTAPPSAPANTGVSVKNRAITLAWTNPAVDFHHIKIYRSAKAGELGAVAFNYLTGTTQTDTLSGTVAYYIVRAVDLAGNESTNVAQLKAEEGVATIPDTVTLSVPITGVKALLITVEGDPRVYIAAGKYKRHIPNPQVFAAYGFKWQDIKTVSSKEAAGFATSALIRVSGGTKVYAVEQGKKRWITSPEEFNAKKYKWDAIMEVNASELAAYPDASGPSIQLLRATGDPKVYVIVSGKKKWIASPAEFNTAGYRWSDIEEVSKETLNAYPDA